MNIGGKIKKLRSEKLMTQSELAGSEITRNMLSRIENGSANPSLETICYLAERLHVSPGFLLAEEGDDRIYFKENQMAAIKSAVRSEDYRIARDLCLRSEISDDDEVQMILGECNLALGCEAFGQGKLRDCAAFLDEAVEACGKTMYRTERISAVAALYFRYMRRLSSTLSSDVMDENEPNVFPALDDAFCRYAVLLEEMDSEEPNLGFCRLLEEQNDPASPLTLHWEAKKSMAAGHFDEAYAHLHTILTGEGTLPMPILYFVFCDLEICCREKEDFKGAYEYANNKPILLQQLLS